MNEEALKQRIQGNVLDTVHAGTAHMRSRAYFVLRAAAAITLAVLALALSGFVLSFIAFSIHESGELFLLGFGARGIAVFFNLFPWLSLMLDGVVILALEWLLAGFRFGYRVSLLSLLAAVFGASAVLAALVYALPIHSLLLDAADRGQLPILGGLYERIHESHTDQGIFRGTVMSVAGDSLVIAHNDDDRDSDDGTRTVLLLPGESGSYKVGQHVYILGTSTGEVVQPYGMERFDR